MGRAGALKKSPSHCEKGFCYRWIFSGRIVELDVGWEVVNLSPLSKLATSGFSSKKKKKKPGYRIREYRPSPYHPSFTFPPSPSNNL